MPATTWVWPPILALLLAGGQWLRRRHWPLNFADEAYLWHGVRLVRSGAVPLRDFRSYEPGRYWWCAAVLRLLGDRLVHLRLAGHLAWALGVGVLGVSMAVHGSTVVVLVATMAAMALWAEPQHKLFEPATMAAGVAVGAAMLGHGSPEAAGAAGLVVGLSSLVGVNVAGYLAVALGVLALFGPAGLPGILALVGGAAAGALPMWTWALATGSLPILWHRRVVTVLKRGSTNLPLPVPWPWRPSTRTLGNWPTAGRRVLQVAFTVLPLLQVTAVAAVAAVPGLRGEHPVLSTSAVVGLVGLHHAFSRADPPHLAQAIVPCLVTIGQLVALIPWPTTRWVAAGALVSLSAIVAHAWPRPDRTAQTTTASGDRITLTPGHARILDTLREYLPDAPARAPLLAVPTLAGLLVVLDRPTAVYDVFCVYPASDTEQDRMIEELRTVRPPVAVVADQPLDGRDELRFSRTHPRVWDWLHHQMVAEPTAALPSGITLLRADGQAAVDDTPRRS